MPLFEDLKLKKEEEEKRESMERDSYLYTREQSLEFHEPGSGD
jgi:hypothetical protein